MKCGESTPIGAGPSQGYGALPPKKGTKPTGKKIALSLQKMKSKVGAAYSRGLDGTGDRAKS